LKTVPINVTPEGNIPFLIIIIFINFVFRRRRRDEGFETEIVMTLILDVIDPEKAGAARAANISG